MLDPKKRDGLKPGDVKFLEIIDKFGWHVMSVAPRTNSEDKEEWFSYSTGLFMRFQHPEIIVCGLNSNDGLGIINEIGNSVKQGKRFGAGEDYTDILADGYKCCFREAHPTQAKEYALFSDWFYEREYFPLLQCFWPDADGNYPWQPACDTGVVNLQPLLYLPICNSDEPIN